MNWFQIQDLMRRRWRIMLGAGIVGLVIGIILIRPSEPLYSLNMRFIIGQPPLDSTLTEEQERYYTWVTSEYVVFGISDWANGTNFLDEVSTRLGAIGLDNDIDEIDAMVDTTASRSTLIVVMQHLDRDYLLAGADVVTNVILDLQGVDIPQLRLAPPELFPVDILPVVEESAVSIQDQLTIPLQIATGLIVALGAAFVLEVRDKTIRSRSAAAALKLPILGEIPRGNT